MFEQPNYVRTLSVLNLLLLSSDEMSVRNVASLYEIIIRKNKFVLTYLLVRLDELVMLNIESQQVAKLNMGILDSSCSRK